MVRQLTVQRHPLHQRRHLLIFLLPAAVEAPGDIVRDVQMGEQRAFLRHVAHPAQVGGNKCPLRKQRAPLHNNAPAIRRFETGEDPQQRGFTGAGGTNYRRPAACGHRQIQVFRAPAYRQKDFEIEESSSIYRPAIFFDWI
ncbi:Uncharacterised protein [Klebsiella michiganensis]|uniref:Uncharacterized protein n=1 Tax=Klebsiella michiganensis TaxID=1134687 RepID=A0A7H4N213_9ENTR|nr:Uncharacterised protein [Klebsiella michiganensis]